MGNRRGWDYLATKGWQNFTRKDNGLNQYRMWSPYSIINYDDDIGNGWGSPGAANGVLMQDGWVTAGYNALNQPMYIWSGNVGWTYFGYDGLGRCVKRWNDAGSVAYMYYDGWDLIQDGPQSSIADRVYVHGARTDEIVAQITPANNWIRYFHYDAMGHCTLQTDGWGGIVEQYDYDAFGFPYFYDASGNATGYYDPQGRWIGYSPWGNRFLFTGREWLSDLKLYDYRNRLYQPELGRFMQPDPKEFAAGDYNLYRYCHNDPVNKSDPLGLEIAFDFSDPSNKAAMEAHLARLERMGGEIGAAVKQLRDSSNKITFGDIQRNVSGWDKNNLPPRDPKDNTFRTTPRNDENSRNDKGTGSYVEINPRDWNSASGRRDPVEGAGHEVRHAAANDKGNRLPGQAEEKRAQQFQLKIREKIKEGY